MKITVINGLLANENEMKKILDLVLHEFDKYDLSINYVDLADEKLNTFGGVSTVQMDQIFNKVLVADALIFASSIHMGNITPLMQNFFNYFELSKYKAAMQNKNVLSVMIHNTNDEIIPYTVMMNFYKKFNAYEVNKLFLNIPDVITDEYLDKTCKYIKTRTKEFAGILNPVKVDKVENDKIDNNKINQMLASDDLKYDETKLTLEVKDNKETNISELTGIINDKLEAKAIISEEPKEKDVKEITQKYKSKIEQMMEETLFGDDDDETVAEKMFEASQEEMNNPIEDRKESFDTINFIKDVETKRETVKTPEELQREKEENESIDSLIARVVARTKVEREAEKENEIARVEDLASRMPSIPKAIETPVLEEQTFEEPIVEEKRYEEPIEMNDDYEEELSFEEEYNVKDNYMDGQLSLDEEDDIQFIRTLKSSDEELKRKANELNDIRFLKDTTIEETKRAEVAPVKEQVNEDVNRFEPESIRELRRKLNNIRIQRDEIVNEVNEMKNEMDSELKEVQEQKVSISKFSLPDFQEPHEVIEYEEVPTIKETSNSKMSLKDMTKNLMYLFKPLENEDIKAIVQINVEGEEGFKVYANIIDNKCAIYDGINTSNDMTIYVKDEKWRSILDGEVTLQRAFMTGLVKVTGNFMMLNKLDNTLLAYNKE